MSTKIKSDLVRADKGAFKGLFCDVCSVTADLGHALALTDNASETGNVVFEMDSEKIGAFADF